jgi:hypothetical protein
MKNLLELALEAHGGLTPWSQLKTVTADLSVTGALWRRSKNMPGHCMKRRKIRIRRWSPLISPKSLLASPLSPLRDTFYTFDARGYTDYPFYEEQSEPVGSTSRWGSRRDYRGWREERTKSRSTVTFGP